MCKDLDKYTLKNKNMEPDDFFTDWIHINERIENIIGDFKNTDKKLLMNIMNNMCN